MNEGVAPTLEDNDGRVESLLDDLQWTLDKFAVQKS
jgi:hypothetical protein